MSMVLIGKVGFCGLFLICLLVYVIGIVGFRLILCCVMCVVVSLVVVWFVVEVGLKNSVMKFLKLFLCFVIV